MDNSESSIDIMCMLLECGLEASNVEKTHINTGGTCKLMKGHKQDYNPEPQNLEVDVRTTALHLMTSGYKSSIYISKRVMLRSGSHAIFLNELMIKDSH